MATISQTQLQNLINSAPKGVTADSIVSELRRKGHTINADWNTVGRMTQQPTTQTSNPYKRDRTFSEKASDVLDTFFGGKKVGEAIGTQIAKWSLPKEQRQYVSEGPSGSEIAGDLIKMGTTVASAALPATKATTLFGRVATGAATGFGQGALLGTAEALREQDNVVERMWGTGVTGAIIGGMFPLVTEGFKRAGNKIYDSIFAKTPGAVKRELTGKVVNPTDELLKKRSVGSTKRILNATKSNLDEIESAIAKEAAKSTKTINGGIVLDDVLARTASDMDNNLNPDAVQKILKKSNLPFAKLTSGQSLTTTEANSLRKIIDHKFIGNSKWMSASPDPLQVTVLKNASNTLREFVQGSSDQLPGLFGESQALIVAKGLLEDTMSKSKGFFRNIAESGIIGSSVMGSIVTGSPAPTIAAGGLVGAGRIATSAPVKSAVGVGLNELSNVLSKLPEGITRAELLNWVNRVRPED